MEHDCRGHTKAKQEYCRAGQRIWEAREQALNYHERMLGRHASAVSPNAGVYGFPYFEGVRVR